MRGVGLIVPDPRTHDLNPFSRVIIDVEGCEWKLYILSYLVWDSLVYK